MEENQNLPENANRELAPGEVYEPVMKADKKYPEANTWSVGWGILMAVIFSAATAYLGLKVGQVFEAAIPIAIIAMGLSTTLRRKHALGENVIIQSIGSASGVIVAGTIFTLPALYILQAKYPEISVNFLQIFMSALLGGILGILFLIPFRRYFVSDMHGKYPFPEATATTQVLAAGTETGEGKKNKTGIKLLMISGLIGGVYDFVVATFGCWTETITSKIIPVGELLSDKYKIIFKHNVGAALLGLGYIVGLKYAAIICAGSFLSWYVFIPFLSYFGDAITVTLPEGTKFLSDVSPETIFGLYIRQLGIGGIAMAGVIGIIRSRKIIFSAMRLAGKEMKSKQQQVTNNIVPRTQRDLPMKFIIGGLALVVIAILLFFYFGVIPNLTITIVALLTVIIIAFLFTTVAANAIAIVGTNPVSGMTLMTLILASAILFGVGLSGTVGMVAALIIGGVVCTALSMAGGFITDLKIGYWLGSTPAVQQQWKFLGTLVSALTVGGVMMILSETYGFSGKNALAAPQANAMAAVIEPMMSGQSAPWLIYFAGAAIALILTMLNIPALAFALGMFIPIELNTPLLVGGLISWYVSRKSKDNTLNQKRHEQGLLVASGFIAGGALFGVLSASLTYFGVNLHLDWAYAEHIGILPYLLLICIMLWLSKPKGLAK